ncbi:thiamine pyrophosphate-binding protein [Nocardioides marmoriginsengisoli]|uniref:thiamine pyrophosphate-binding protein n=1 Tax=Nocardioides marmoriginsengisoli TaxID=661483 RepID=UPI0016133DC6|nr:thiamine pyrophosphate-binding protein [Nocardioides marmoriginsengisoli]
MPSRTDVLVPRRLAAALRELGVDTVFGLMGDGNLHHLIDFDDLGGTVVTAVTEGAAVSMADGYARVGSRLGVASVTHGPGATNMLTALVEAVRARTPLIVLTGDTVSRPDHLQALDLRALATVAGAGYHRVLRAEDVAGDLDAVVRRVLRSGTPVLFDVPVDLHGTEAAEAPILRPVDLGAGPAPGADDLDRALGVLASARRPVILAGRGAAGSRDEILRLAAVLGAPVGTTLLGKGLFAGEPLDLGVIGTLSSEVTARTVGDADCVLVLGAGLNRYTTVDGSLFAGAAVVHVDHDALRLSGAAAVGVVADVGAAVLAMTELLVEVEHPGSSGHPADLAERLAAHDPYDEFTDRSGVDTLDGRTVMLALDAVLPRERVVVTDTGRFVYAPWRYLGVAAPTDFVHTCNFASIGLGLGTAIGAAVASGRLTVAVVGDGGGLMNLLELSTAVRLGLPLVVVVCNDGAYGMEYRHLVHAGLDPSPARCAWPDFVEIGRALGADAITVRTREELDRAGELFAEVRRPLLLDVRCDPSVDVGEAS